MLSFGIEDEEEFLMELKKFLRKEEKEEAQQASKEYEKDIMSLILLLKNHLANNAR